MLGWPKNCSREPQRPSPSRATYHFLQQLPTTRLTASEAPRPAQEPSISLRLDKRTRPLLLPFQGFSRPSPRTPPVASVPYWPAQKRGKGTGILFCSTGCQNNYSLELLRRRARLCSPRRGTSPPSQDYSWHCYDASGAPLAVFAYDWLWSKSVIQPAPGLCRPSRRASPFRRPRLTPFLPLSLAIG